jgi:Transcription-repair coupling factor (superfamily II helicase)
LDKIQDEEALTKFEEKLKDRFGKIPNQVYELFMGLRLRWVCKELGIEKISLKNQKLRCIFVTNPQSAFYDSTIFQRIMQYPAYKGDRFFSFKQVNNSFNLIREQVKSVQEAIFILENLRDFCVIMA